MTLDEFFRIGTTMTLGSHTFEPEAIKAFARKYDPQIFHIDEEAARKSVLGGLCASGWHTCAMFMRMLCDAFLLDSTCQGAPGVDQVKWKKPVLAGDTLRGNLVVLAKRLSRSKPQLGFITMRSELVNQRGESVFELENSVMFLTRDAAGNAA